MKKTLIILIYFLLLIPWIAQAEPPLEWEEDTTYLYGMSIRQSDGRPLPKPPLNAGLIKEGLTINIQNGMPQEDTSLLLFVLNGQILPFSVKGEEETYYHEIYLAANAGTDIEVCFAEWPLTEAEIQFLHVVSVGLLAWMPEDEHDYMDVYANICSIPFHPHEQANIKLSDNLHSVWVSDATYSEATVGGDMIYLTDKIKLGDIYVKPVIEAAELPYSLTVTVIAPEKAVSILPFVDGKPLNPEQTLFSGQAESRQALQAVYELNNLSPGPHQFFAIMLPISDSIHFPVATPRMRLNIEH